MSLLKKIPKNLVISGMALALSFGSAGCSPERPPKKTELTSEEVKRLNESNSPMYFTLQEERYIGSGLMRVEGVSIRREGFVSQAEAYSNPTVTAKGTKYTIKGVKDNGEVIVIDVIDSGTKTKEALAHLLEPGDRIGFTRGNLYEGEEWVRQRSGDQYLAPTLFRDPEVTYFREDTQIGTKYASNIWRENSSPKKEDMPSDFP